MRELLLLVPRTQERRAIETLANARLLHVQDHTRGAPLQGTPLDIGSSSPDAASIAQDLTRTRAIIAAIRAAAPEDIDHAPEPPGGRSKEERIARMRALAERIAEHEREITAATAQAHAEHLRLEALEHLPPVAGDVRALVTSRSTGGVLVLDAQRPQVRDVVSAQATRAIARVEDGDRTLLLFKRIDAPDALAHLKSSGARVADLAPLAQARGTREEAILHTRAVIAAQERTIAHERASIARIAEHLPFLRSTERMLALELLKAQAPLRFGATAHVTLIRGWVPAARSQELLDALKGSGVTHVADLTDPVDAPTLLSNPRPVRGFEALLAMYSLPRYREIDPTSVMAVTFPVFFGFMLGDIGYGLLVLLLAILIARSRPLLRPFAEVLGISAVSAVLFGVAFGEVFGLETILGWHLPYLLHRTADPMTLGMLALAFGVLHVNLGLLFGLITESREHGIAHGILRKGGWFAVEAGIALLLLGWSWPWWALGIGLGATALAWSEGLLGIVELPTLITHTLSYLRLAAIGLSSVFLAAVTNEIGGSLVMGGGIGILTGSLVLIIGHAINLALGLFGPFLHSLRLHYAEFFLKFYEGGGRAYEPFGDVRVAEASA